jgi:hypothetical protein
MKAAMLAAAGAKTILNVSYYFGVGFGIAIASTSITTTKTTPKAKTASRSDFLL